MRDKLRSDDILNYILFKKQPEIQGVKSLKVLSTKKIIVEFESGESYYSNVDTELSLNNFIWSVNNNLKRLEVYGGK